MLYINVRENSLYKLGAKESTHKTKFATIIIMLDHGEPPHKIANYVQVPQEYVWAIRDEIRRKEVEDELISLNSDVEQK